jgi:hypothetical protein
MVEFRIIIAIQITEVHQTEPAALPFANAAPLMEDPKSALVDRRRPVLGSS